jgi:hypothetical protein
MDRHEQAARGIWTCKEGFIIDELFIKKTAEYLREHFPDEPEPQLTDMNLRVVAEQVAIAVVDELAKDPTANVVDWSEVVMRVMRECFDRQGMLPEPKGRCGECRWWLAGVKEDWQVLRCTEPGNETLPTPLSTGPWLPKDASCPRFEKREDRAARMARELAETYWNKAWHGVKDWQAEIADFLRRNGVEGE